MARQKTFTDRLLSVITIFIVILLIFWGVTIAKMTWECQRVEHEKELLSIATLILNEVTSLTDEINRIKHNDELTTQDKIFNMNEVLQIRIETIAKQYPNIGMGYYDIEIDSTIASAPNFEVSQLKEFPHNAPFFKSYESGKPEFVMSDTSIIWFGQPIIAVTVPVFEQGKIIGHTFANIRTTDFNLISLLEAGKIVSVGLVLWLIIFVLVRRSLRNSLKVISEFSRQITDEEQEITISSKIPELAPVLEKIHAYTKRLKESNKQFNLSQTLLNTIVEGITDGFYALNNNWCFTYLNNGAKQATFNSDDLIGANIWEEYPQTKGTESYLKLHEAKTKNIPIHWETYDSFDDRYYSHSAYPYDNGLTVFFRDITEDRIIKHRLVELAAIVESSNDAIVSMTLDGVINTWNRAAEKMFGYRDYEVKGKHISILVPEGFSYEEQLLEAIQKRKKVDSLETVRQNKQGQIINVSVSISPLVDENGLVYGASSIFHDISRRVKTEKQLKEEIIQRKHSEANLKSIFDNPMVGIIIGSISGKVWRTNKALDDMLGYAQGEINSLDLRKICHPDDLAELMELDRQLNGGERDNYEIKRRLIRKDGTIIWCSLLVVLTSKELSERYVIVFIQDISEKVLMENQMVKLDQLNLIGEMAAGISHEVRNPMATIRGFLQILQTKDECANYRDYFDIMIEELDRANTIITEFLSIGRIAPVNLQEENLNTIVESLKPLIEADGLTQDKYLNVETSEVPNLLLNNKEIRQLILNLCRNGLEAMASGGTLKICTSCEQGNVILAVQDQGSGISPEVMAKLGTPFFTTKKDGTGLGLGICYSIAARHNADIRIDTNPNGTTFYVVFKDKPGKN